MTPEQVKLLVQAAVCVALWIGGAVTGWMINGWRLSGDLATCNGALAREQDANASFADAVKEQNKGVTALIADGKRREAEGKKAEAEARMKAAALLANSQALLARPLPKSPAEDCGVLGQELDEAIRKRRMQ